MKFQFKKKASQYYSKFFKLEVFCKITVKFIGKRVIKNLELKCVSIYY